jgi:transposase
MSKKIFVGVDVSKSSLDVHVLPPGKWYKFGNDAQGICELLKVIGSSKNLLVVLESTGGYELDVFCMLQQADVKVARINPQRVRSFAKACGKLAKTDKVDAETIAWFALKMEPRHDKAQDGRMMELKALAARRGQLISMRTSELNRKEHARDATVKRSVGRVVKMLNAELQDVEGRIQNCINAMPEIKARQELLESVKGVGVATSAMLVTELPELGELNRRQVAALTGTAPINRDSGQLRGKRITGGGRCKIRTQLFMPTLVAVRFNPQLRQMYMRLLVNGKSKMAAVIACMRKLLIIMNQMVAKNQPWNPKFA